MSDIAELERRIMAALERIGTGVDGLEASATTATEESDDGSAALKDALEAEKLANAQLEERVNAIKQKQETTVKEMQEQIKSLTTDLIQKENDSKKLLNVNAQLLESNDALRKANESGVGDAHLINKAMQTELESLRTTRKADLAELETIMAELKPLVGAQSEPQIEPQIEEDA
ncbi:hypothetical protein JI58_02900 [Marinosulfonomonas sp. PRT-SC04]|nr:hypothetical protein JI58_02900 [Marinosulfonomonas sp. PRT-SC04]